MFVTYNNTLMNIYEQLNISMLLYYYCLQYRKTFRHICIVPIFLPNFDWNFAKNWHFLSVIMPLIELLSKYGI